jgi:hypothetical protein
MYITECENMVTATEARCINTQNRLTQGSGQTQTAPPPPRVQCDGLWLLGYFTVYIHFSSLQTRMDTAAILFSSAWSAGCYIAASVHASSLSAQFKVRY